MQPSLINSFGKRLLAECLSYARYYAGIWGILGYGKLSLKKKMLKVDHNIAVGHIQGYKRRKKKETTQLAAVREGFTESVTAGMILKMSN